MKLTTVLSSVNNNPNYYKFIPKQILFWNHFNIKFIAVFVGEKIPEELENYKKNIILWSKNLDLNTAYVGQNLRIFYTALIDLPEDEMIMITDMDMLPTNDTYYKENLENYNKNDFIIYNYNGGDQIFICYNAAHPNIWGSIFNIKSENDIEKELYKNYDKEYDGIPGCKGWCIDQYKMYIYLRQYPYIKVLNRPIKRLEISMYLDHLKNNDKNFIKRYDDVHFHRSYENNLKLILDAENQLLF
jgi:hypothetical protein